MDGPTSRIDTLTFDIFGTVLDLSATIVPAVREFLAEVGADDDPHAVWADWRARQRLEQHQDTILMLGHRGYLDSARRALLHTVRRRGLPRPGAALRELLGAFHRLRPFADAGPGLARLGQRYRLVALSNGDEHLLEELAGGATGVRFDRLISVDCVGRFKPHPGVYRQAAGLLDREPGQIMMVAAHAFDILGARACAYRGAYVNRYQLPYEESALVPDLEVRDFGELADRLLEP